jgi:hypothetical protein
MGGPDVEAGAGLCIQPAAERAAAREDEAVLAVFVDHGQFKFAVKRRAGDGLPHCSMQAGKAPPSP